MTARLDLRIDERIEALHNGLSTAVLAFVVGLAACSSPTTIPATTIPATTIPSTTLGGANPQRIVSLSATHTEVLYAIGAESQIAATDLTSDFPPSARETPKVDAFNFNIEEVVALNPDLVVLAFDFNGEVEALAAVGIESLLLPPPVDITEALDQIVQLGEAVGRLDAAVRVSSDLKRDIGEVLDATPRRSPAPTFFHEIDATLFSPNSATFLGDIFSQFGLVNIADEVPDDFGSGFVQLSAEFILESDPDLVFLGDADFGESADTIAARPGWESLTALREGNVFELDADISGRWGPRTLQLVTEIAAALDSLQ